MTAIAGVLRLDSAPADITTLRRMEQLLAPYGRDAQDTLIAGAAGFVRTLLRTTPEDAADVQPLEDPASRCVLLFDGRLDNRAELAEGLGLSRADIAGMADSTLALRACLRWDTAAPQRMLGDFALAMWQPAAQRLWLARSPLGNRPLFWYQKDKLFAFATMPKALLAIPGVTSAVCEKWLYQTLVILPRTGPESPLEDVMRVEPGHVLLLEQGRVRSFPFHRFDVTKELRLRNDDEYVEAFREQLERAVGVRLRSCGRVASHLSSGFDSSTVAAVAAIQLAARGESLLAYTALPSKQYNGPAIPDRHTDESAGATALARRFANIEHTLVRPHEVSAMQLLASEIARLDQAPTNPTNTSWIRAIAAHSAQRGAKVVLNGQCGNMTISYSGHLLVRELLKQGRLAAWWREARGQRRHGSAWETVMSRSLGALVPDAVFNLAKRLRGQEIGTDYCPAHPAFVGRMSASYPAGLSLRKMDSRSLRTTVLHRTDLGVVFASANCDGLELRDPTADTRLIEFLLSVPEEQFARNGKDRWLLRRAMRGVLPPEITDASTKGLQSADWFLTLSRDLPAMRSMLERQRQSEGASRYLDLAGLASLLERWPASEQDAARQAVKYHLKLTRGLATGEAIRYLENWKLPEDPAATEYPIADFHTFESCSTIPDV